MGALAPISPWIPEDDLLLKNAVENGASLESLAKGAVQFSRKFTIRELQDRWHSLLYDPDISSEASARMVELELSSSNLSSKTNRSGSIKGNEWAHGKRKGESVRNHYYAMRKRICNEPCNPIDLSFFVPPSVHNCTGNGGGCQEQLRLHNVPQIGNSILGDPISNHYGLAETDFDMVHHTFPQLVRGDTAAGGIDGTAHAFHSGHLDPLEDDLPDGIMDKDCMYDFAENVSPVSLKEAIGNGIGHSFEHDDVHKDIPHILGEKSSVFGNCTDVQQMGPAGALPVGTLFETDNLGAKPLSTFDSLSNNHGNVSSGFGGSQGFSSPGSDCSAAFHQLAYSSPLAKMPIWETTKDISTPAVPIDVNPGDKDQGSGDTLAHANDAGAEKISGYSDSKLKERVSGDGLTSSTAISDGDLMDLSDSLLNFTNEEELLFMDVDGKDMMDRLLLSSPNDVQQDDIHSISDPKASAPLDTCVAIPDSACPRELDDIDYQLHSGCGDGHRVCDSEINEPTSMSKAFSCSPEHYEGVICCELNTEDPDIPCNDDVFSSTQVPPSFTSSVVQHNSEETGIVSSFTKDFTDNRRASEQGVSLMKEEGQTSAHSLEAPCMIGSEVLPEMGPSHPVDGCGVKSELPENNSLPLASRHAGSARGDSSQCRVVPVTTKSVPAGVLNEEITKAEIEKHLDFNSSFDSFLEKPVHGYHQNSVGCKQEADMPITSRDHVLSHAEPCSIEMAFSVPVGNPSKSDQEICSDSDDDVPYFSDVEAMILDMDLGPDDHDSYFRREVLRYQDDDTRRAIIRLEQGAQSYIRRAIASHGAFAILYGRHLKHYIKKPEVLLGRATHDVNVDIDLGREGRANKISRRQAIIKMEMDGSFCLKNLGKCPILVNSKEVATGQRLSLSSSCLIEVRGMRFMFESNQNSEAARG